MEGWLSGQLQNKFKIQVRILQLYVKKTNCLNKAYLLTLFQVRIIESNGVHFLHLIAQALNFFDLLMIQFQNSSQHRSCISKHSLDSKKKKYSSKLFGLFVISQRPQDRYFAFKNKAHFSLICLVNGSQKCWKAEDCIERCTQTKNLRVIGFQLKNIPQIKHRTIVIFELLPCGCPSVQRFYVRSIQINCWNFQPLLQKSFSRFLNSEKS